MNCFEEAIESLKFELTLSKLLSKSAQELKAKIKIGRILLYHQKKFDFALKLFLKAKRDAEKYNAKPEEALCCGYLAECYLGIGEVLMVCKYFLLELNLFMQSNA